MNQFNRLRIRAGARLAGFTLACAAAAGCATAETFQHGGSTTTVEQHGGPAPSRSEIYRYPDGQAVITRDGSSTDITVQRSAPPLPPDSGGWPSEPNGERFDRDALAERFSGVAPGGDASAPGTREAFRQRMLERLDRPLAR